MDSFSSLSNSLSRRSVLENDEAAASPAGGPGWREIDAISNEQIRNGDLILGAYRVISDPILGGMGSVWRVRHQEWKADLAMKRPQPRFFAEGGDRKKEQFVHECEYWINLGLHPNIVSCYYVREIGGVPTIFSEWMENGDLASRIRDGMLYGGSEGEVQKRLLDIAVQCARGLDYAHHNGLIHQDIKPANLLLTNDWQTKVADFGLANARAQLGAAGNSPEPAGDGGTVYVGTSGYTKAYCSPEQKAGMKLTRRTDLYSWAVSVLEMYLGARPWPDGTEAGRNCREYMAGCRVPMPDALQDLLASCLAGNADERPHDFGEVTEKLVEIWRGAFGEDYPRPESKAAGDTAESLNNRALTFLDLGMPEKAEQCWAKALERESDHLETVYNQGLYQWRRGRMRPEDVARRCDEIRQAAADPELAETSSLLLERIMAEAEDNSPCASFGDYKRNRVLGFWHARTRLSPDGQKIYAAFNSLAAFRISPPKELWERHGGFYHPNSMHEFVADMLEVTPDGKYLLFHKVQPNSEEDMSVRRESRIWVADADTGEILRSLEGHSGAVTAVCAYPDSVHCVTAGEDNRIIKWDLTTGRRVASAGQARVFRKLAVSGDGRLLCGLDPAGYQDRSAVRLWDAVSLSPVEAQEPDRNIYDFCFAPDGKRIYAAGVNGFTVWEPETSAAAVFPTETAQKMIRAGADGTTVVTCDRNNRMAVRDAGTFTLLRVLSLPDPRDTVSDLDVSPDLSLIAVTDDNRNVLLWNLRTGARGAPWELSRIREYRAVMDRQQKDQQLREQMEAALRDGRIDEALQLLRQAESEFSPHLFFGQRRKIARHCVRGRLTGWYEIASFQSDAWQEVKDDNSSFHQGCVAFHPLDGTVAIRYDRSGLIEFREDTGRPTGSLRLPDNGFDYRNGLNSLCYSPSGDRLAVGGENAVLLLKPGSGETAGILEGPSRQNFTVVFSPDGRRLATLNQMWYVNLWDCAAGEMIMKTPETCTGMALIRNGKQLALLNRKELQVCSLPDGKPVTTVRLEKKCDALALSRDGKTLFLYGDDKDERRVLTLDTDTWETAVLFTAEPDNEYSYLDGSLCVSPDDALLAVTKEEQITLCSLRNGTVEGTMTLTDEVDHTAVSPDGNVLIAACKENIYCWALQWELSFPGWKDRDEQAEPVIRQFLENHPHPDEKERQALLQELCNRGFGYLRPESVLAAIKTDY